MWRALWLWFHKTGSPPYFYDLSGRLVPWFGAASALLMVAGLYGGLIEAPADYQQGESYRIIFIHVPSAWMSLFIYMVMATAGAAGLIWHVKLAEIVLTSSAAVGASFTFLALVTGSLWGKPMWGTYWVWDARLTAELILLFLYLGVIGLMAAIEDRRAASRAAAVLALVGVVNIPIIHYSVEWWNTLHQGPTVTKLDKPSIHLSMLVPLLLMALAFKLFYVTVLLMRARCELLDRERNSAWVRETFLGTGGEGAAPSANS
jgi:heme exporter protein C